MKKYFIYTTIIALILTLTGCSSSQSKKPLLKVNYFIYFDKFTSNDIKLFENIFNKFSLANTLPEGYSKVSFNIFSTSLSNNNSLVLTMEDDEDLGIRCNSFLKELKSNLDTLKKDVAIFSNFNDLVNQLSTDEQNEIIFYTNWLEDSGGQVDDPQKDESWRDGKFRFIENNVCLPEHIDEVERQLKDTNSWIYQNLINKASDIPKNTKIIHLQFSRNEVFSNGNYNKNRIYAFWDSLFSKMSLKYPKKSEHVKLIDYPFFKD